MAKVTIQIQVKDHANNTKTTKIPYVNPEASNSTLVQFATKLNALTTNTYVKTTKITEERID